MFLLQLVPSQRRGLGVGAAKSMSWAVGSVFQMLAESAMVYLGCDSRQQLILMLTTYIDPILMHIARIDMHRLPEASHITRLKVSSLGFRVQGSGYEF